jgi:energy-coupling factor transporter ATP-binding protein EcfA2
MSKRHAFAESMRDDLAKVVVTASYQKAATALDKHGFVLLVGEPAAGKTTIASMLAMAAVDKWGALMLKLDDPGKVADRWDPDEPSQFFWVDDAFGVQQYEDVLVHGWNSVLPQIRTMLRKGAKIVMTSRDYIYHSARKDLKQSAFPLLKESQVVIDVHDLSLEEKQQILYNHLKLGRQRHEFRRAVKPHLEAVAAHERFVPETARRLSSDSSGIRSARGGSYTGRALAAGVSAVSDRERFRGLSQSLSQFGFSGSATSP